MVSAGKKGALGEDIAARYLQRLGYRIIERNFRIRGGEIDVIAANDAFVLFVEVKLRSAGAMVSGAEAVGRHKASRIVKAACRWLEQQPACPQPRFDVIEITLTGKKASINHIENAFGAEVCDEVF